MLLYHQAQIGKGLMIVHKEVIGEDPDTLPEAKAAAEPLNATRMRSGENLILEPQREVKLVE